MASTCQNYHGKVIRASELAGLKFSRNGFLDHVDYFSSPLFYMPIDVKEITERGVYKLLTSGTLPNGEKLIVLINGIYPYLDIKYSDDAMLAKIRRELSDIFDDRQKATKLLERARDMEGFVLKPVKLLRVFFPNTKMRKEAITHFSNFYKLASDIETCYYRVVCGGDKAFKFGVVNVVKNYKMSSFTRNRANEGKSTNVIEVDISDITVYTGDILNDPLLSRFKTMVCTYDEEMFSPSGALPDAYKQSDKIFMDHMSFLWASETVPILAVTITTRPCAAHAARLTIVAKDEKELLQTKAIVFGRMLPDIVMGFNNGGYDEIFVIEKSVQYGILSFMESQMALYLNNSELNMSNMAAVKRNDESIYTWNCKRQKLKLESGVSQDFTSMKFFGYIVLDIRMAYRMMYPTEEKSSLNHYLKMTNSSLKEDMPINKMFGIYRRSIELTSEMSKHVVIPEELLLAFKQNKEDMSEVAHYCKMDAELCQVLQVKGSIINDKSNMASLTGISLHDAIHSAGGLKVKSLIASFAEANNIACSMRSIDRVFSDEKYVGAYVVDPVTSICKSKLSFDELKQSEWQGIPDVEIEKCKSFLAQNPPVLALDAYEASEASEAPRKSIAEFLLGLSAKTAEAFQKWVKQSNCYPVADLDFTSLYPSIIMSENYSPEMLIKDPAIVEAALAAGHNPKKILGSDAWAVHHDTIDGNSTKFGLYPTILRQLFKWRADCKLEIAKIKKMEVEASEKESLTLYWDTKQKAIKVLMNTFYGVLGEKTNPLYRLPIALGITLQGQRLIKFAQSMLTTTDSCKIDCLPKYYDMTKSEDENTQGCKLWYGDTDSCYISFPQRFYFMLDNSYYSGRISKDTYIRECLKITSKLIKPFQKLVNDALIVDTGTVFLKMENEKIYFAILFLEKKMYAYSSYNPFDDFDTVSIAPHIGTKGLAMNKRGGAEMVKISQKNILTRLLDHYNLKSIIQVLKEEITALLLRYKNIDMTNIHEFTKTAMYKPGVNNVNVKRFNERLMARGSAPLEAAERFTYVIVSIDTEYTITGKRIEKLQGDQWEYATQFIDCPKRYEIDLLHYIQGGVDGMMAQFAATVIFEEEQDHKKRIDMSKKYISNLFKQEMGMDVIANRGKERRKEFTDARRVYRELLAHHIFVGIHFKDGSDMYEVFKARILKENKLAITAMATRSIADFVARYGRKCLHNMYAAYSADNGIIETRVRHLKYKEDEMRRHISVSQGVVNSYESEYTILINMLKSLSAEDKVELTTQIAGGKVEYDFEEFMDVYKKHLVTVSNMAEAYGKLNSIIIVSERAIEIGRILATMVLDSAPDLSEDKKMLEDFAKLIDF